MNFLTPTRFIIAVILMGILFSYIFDLIKTKFQVLKVKCAICKQPTKENPIVYIISKIGSFGASKPVCEKCYSNNCKEVRTNG